MKLCGFEVGLDAPFFLIAGPCVIESEELALTTASDLKQMTAELGIPFIYKSSFDKANRSSGGSYRGPGMEEGLRILQKVRDEVQVPVLTDVHEDTPLDEVNSQPQYFVRQVASIGGITGALNLGPGYGAYRGAGNVTTFEITARGTGGKDTTQVVVRSHFGRTGL